jgi:desulfoferrodoxin-like iron-binding protein
MANKTGKKYNCETCGAQVIVSKGGVGTVECCGRPMTQA